MTVNHNVHFVDPQTGATTNHVEAMWGRAKLRNKKECGTSRTHLCSYLIEFMWRAKFGDDPFQNLLAHLREVYSIHVDCKLITYLGYFGLFGCI